MKSIQSVRGMNDLLPKDSATWQYAEEVIAEVVQAYGYREIRFPILEPTELFKRSIGEVTDIVEKEMYTFEDRNGESVTMRPEGTAGCVRAAEQHGLLYNQTQRLWYMGPMFRYEKPQKGRLRQFHQVGVEAFGMPGPDIDAELLLLCSRLWQELGIDADLSLQLNSLGTSQSRAVYRAELVEFLNDHSRQLDEDSQRRLQTNPLRILDSKDANTQALLARAPDLKDYLDQESQDHFQGLCTLLDSAEISYQVNTRLVRGLDYYGKTVFEWVTDRLGAQGAVCAGGRYDGLVAQCGGRDTPAVGFAMGIERLVLLLQTQDDFVKEAEIHPDVYIVATGEVFPQAMVLGEWIRDEFPHLVVVNHCGGGGFKNQLKKADKSGAELALIIGEDEVKQDKVTVKYLRQQRDQQLLSVEEVMGLLDDLTIGDLSSDDDS